MTEDADSGVSRAPVNPGPIWGSAPAASNTPGPPNDAPPVASTPAPQAPYVQPSYTQPPHPQPPYTPPQYAQPRYAQPTTQLPVYPPPPRRRRRISTLTASLIAGGTAFAAVLTVVVVVGIHRGSGQPGTPAPAAQPGVPAPTSTYASPDITTTTTSQPVPPTSTGAVPEGYMPETGPAGIQVNVPSGWSVSDPFASEDEADAPDGSGSLIRYGGTPSPSMSLLDAVGIDKSGNTSVTNDYQQLRLDEVSSHGGDDTVEWEFLFDKDGVQRHALGWFWRANGHDYVVYFSTIASNWASLAPVVDAVTQSAGPV